MQLNLTLFSCTAAGIAGVVGVAGVVGAAGVAAKPEAQRCIIPLMRLHSCLGCTKVAIPQMKLLL